MSIYTVIRRTALALTAALVCATLPAQAQTKPGVIVFASIALGDAMKAIATAYEAKTGAKVTLSVGATDAMARQIDQGAPADIYMPGGGEWMDFLAKNNRIVPDSRHNLLSNRMVLIGGAGSKPLTVAPKFDLAGALGGGKLSLPDPARVPAGIAGKAALTVLGVWDGVADKIASAQNGRAAVIAVAKGEAPYGVVYESDATLDPGAHVVSVFPENAYRPIIYPVALTRTAAPDAKAFLAYLSGSEAAAIFRKAGFSPAP